MYLGFHEEGDRCPEIGCTGKLDYMPVKNCSCHTNPPCGACVSNPLICGDCGFEEEAPDYKEVPVAPGLLMREYRPRKLDSTKVSYRIKMHSGSSQICDGVYPHGTSQADVRAIVKGTFGGRFESFGGGRFTFIAYTD